MQSLRFSSSMIPLPPNCHTVVASLHPSFAMHGLPQFWGSIYTAIQRAERWAGKEEGPARPRAADLLLDPTVDELASYLDGATFLSVDVETPRDDRYTIELCGVSKGPGSGVVFPWREPHISIMREVLEASNVAKVGHNFSFDDIAFRAAGIRMAGTVLDTIQAAALLWPPFREARRRRWSALTTCCARVLDFVPMWKHPEDGATQAFYRAAFPAIPDWLHPRLYCALDCIYTGALWPRLRTLLEQEGMLYLYLEIVAPAARVLVDMEERGFPVDVAERERLRAAATDEKEKVDETLRNSTDAYHRKRLQVVESAVEILQQRAGEAAISPFRNTPACVAHPDYTGLTRRAKCAACAAICVAEGGRRAEVRDLRRRVAKGRAVLRRIGSTFQAGNDGHWRWLLFEKEGLGLKPVERTKKKKEPKVDDRSIEALQMKHPDIEVLRWRVQMQELKHRLSGILAMPLVMDEADGERAHFAYSQHLTANQRIASGLDNEEDDKRRGSPGNAQNIKPADRRIFVASAPDRTLIHYDWKQVELYRVAWLAEDYDLLEAIWDGADIHSLNAATIFGCTPEAARSTMVRFEGGWKDARYAAKRATHGWDYYMGARLTARLYGLKEGEAQKAIAAYFGRWRAVRAWQERQIDRASTTRHLTNSFGYKLRFFGFTRNRDGAWRIADPAIAVAFAPASEVAFMAKKVLPPLNAVRVGDSKLLTMTHDSFTFDVQRDALEEHVATVQPILEKEWDEFGVRRGRKFAAKVEVAVGRNWGKHHEHGAKCQQPCQVEENKDGLVELD